MSVINYLPCKDSANRAVKKQACLIFLSEMQPILSKDSANRAEKKQACLKVFASECNESLFSLPSAAKTYPISFSEM